MLLPEQVNLNRKQRKNTKQKQTNKKRVKAHPPAKEPDRHWFERGDKTHWPTGYGLSETSPHHLTSPHGRKSSYIVTHVFPNAIKSSNWFKSHQMDLEADSLIRQFNLECYFNWEITESNLCTDPIKTSSLITSKQPCLLVRKWIPAFTAFCLWFGFQNCLRSSQYTWIPYLAQPEDGCPLLHPRAHRGTLHAELQMPQFYLLNQGLRLTFVISQAPSQPPWFVTSTSGPPQSTGAD